MAVGKLDIYIVCAGYYDKIIITMKEGDSRMNMFDTNDFLKWLRRFL